MITTVCIYIAGTLFAVDGERALPIGPMSMLVDSRGGQVSAIGSNGWGVRKFAPDQTLAEFLLQCDEQAARKVMEREEW